MIILTGGEPLLEPDFVIQVIDEIRAQNLSVPIILYTAKVDDLYAIRDILMHRRSEGTGLNGLTVTIHEDKDRVSFNHFNFVLNSIRKQHGMFSKHTFRLNVFKGVKMNLLSTVGWTVKSNITWIKNCPLPDNEVFMRHRLCI